MGALRHKEGVMIDGRSLKALRRLDAEALAVPVEGTGDGEATMNTTRSDLLSLLKHGLEKEVEGRGRISVITTGR